MNETYLNNFAKEIATEAKAANTTDEKFIDWQTLATILVFQGIPIILPELKEWVKLGMAAVALKRQEIEKKLRAVATEKELDYDKASLVAGKVAANINEKNVKSIISAIEETIDEDKD